MASLDEAAMRTLHQRSRRAALVSAIGAVIVFVTLGVLVVVLGRLTAEVAQKQGQIKLAAQQLAAYGDTISAKRSEFALVQAQITAGTEQLAALQRQLEQQKADARQRNDDLVDQFRAAADANACGALAHKIAGDQPKEAPRRDRARALWRDGYSAFLRKDVTTAVKRYHESIAADPSYWPPYNSLGRIEVENAIGKNCTDPAGLDRAEALLRQALAASPTYLVAKRNLAVVELRRGHTDEAIRLANETLAADPGNPRALEILAEARARPNQSRLCPVR